MRDDAIVHDTPTLFSQQQRLSRGSFLEAFHFPTLNENMKNNPHDQQDDGTRAPR